MFYAVYIGDNNYIRSNDLLYIISSVHNYSKNKSLMLRHVCMYMADLELGKKLYSEIQLDQNVLRHVFDES